MIYDLFAWLLTTFVIGPVQADIADRIKAAEAPAAIVQQLKACMVNGAPTLIDRAASDPWWGITTTISVAAGFTNAEAIVAGASPECAAAVSAVRPFLEGPEA